MQQLKALLRQIDGRGYKAYKALKGCYQFPDFQLIIDHVQGDPYAAASRVRVRLDADTAALPVDSYRNATRRLALEDFLCRAVAEAIEQRVRGGRGTGHSGEIRITRCGQQVLPRDALVVDRGQVEARLGVALPAAGRRILAGEAMTMLFEELTEVVCQALLYPNLDQQALNRQLDSVEDQQFLRHWLRQNQLIAFVGDGAILPRRSGIDDRPLDEGAITFLSPASLAVEVQLPHAGCVRGMAIGSGMTLIVGGGFHGKSTLLQALELAVYDHIPGDGRERVVCDPGAVKIRAEDGRSINRIDISSFINNLPLGRNTRDFSTSNASGSTSQAAAIMEALACGSRTLLIDEDTSASNFLFRDQRMQMLIAPDQEPITPLLDRIDELVRHQGVSILMVAGGSSAGFDIADRVIRLDRYRVLDVSQQVSELSVPVPPVSGLPPLDLNPTRNRRLATSAGQIFNDRRSPKIRTFATDKLHLDDFRIDMERVEQLMENGQLTAIGLLICRLLRQQQPTGNAGKRNSHIDSDSLLTQLQQLMTELYDSGLDPLSPYFPEPHGGLSMPRLQELFAALNRFRELELDADQ